MQRLHRSLTRGRHLHQPLTLQVITQYRCWILCHRGGVVSLGGFGVARSSCVQLFFGGLEFGLLGNGGESGRDGSRIDGLWCGVGLVDQLLDQVHTGLGRLQEAVHLVGGEEGLRQGHRVAAWCSRAAQVGPDLLQLLLQHGVGPLKLQYGSLEVLVLLCQSLSLLSLSLPGGLSCSAVSEHALYAALLLLIISLGPLPARR